MTLSITDKPLSRSGFNLNMVVFVERGNQFYSEINLWSREENRPHIVWMLGLESKPH